MAQTGKNERPPNVFSSDDTGAERRRQAVLLRFQLQCQKFQRIHLMPNLFDMPLRNLVREHPFRFSFFRKLSLLRASAWPVGFLAALAVAPTMAAEPPPNVVMIVSDDQAW